MFNEMEMKNIVEALREKTLKKKIPWDHTNNGEFRSYYDVIDIVIFGIDKYIISIEIRKRDADIGRGADIVGRGCSQAESYGELLKDLYDEVQRAVLELDQVYLNLLREIREDKAKETDPSKNDDIPF